MIGNLVAGEQYKLWLTEIVVLPTGFVLGEERRHVYINSIYILVVIITFMEQSLYNFIAPKTSIHKYIFKIGNTYLLKNN